MQYCGAPRTGLPPTMAVRLLAPMYRAALTQLRPVMAIRPTLVAPSRWRMQTAAYSAEATPEPRVESQASSAGEPGPAPGDEGFATRRVFVHNLPFETKWSDLKDHFSAAGPVAFASVRPNKGWGVVEFETPDDARAAIDQFANSDFRGRALFVREDRPDAVRDSGEPRRERSGGYDRAPREGGYDRERSGGRGAYDRAPRSYGGGYDRAPRDGGRGGYDRAPRSFERGDDRPPRPRLTPEELEAQRVRTVFVTGLAPDVAWQDLKDHFKPAGQVEFARVVMGQDGLSRGFGLVRFASEDDVQHAVDTLSQTELRGQTISVRPDAGSNALRGGQARQGGYAADPDVAVVLLGLPLAFTWQDMKALCEPYGELGRVELRTHADGTSRGWGMVRFKDAGEAEAAIRALNGTELEGQTLRAKFDERVQRNPDQGWHGAEDN
ncbi:hypothetical protein ACKKBG_A05730 [Auxenochlorella protothecoides x Auxenochlorella symbiontica]